MRGPGRIVIMVLAATAAAGALPACDEPAPTCASLERRLAAIVDADRARAPAAGASAFVPVLDRSLVGELGGRCRAGSLSDAARRCLGSARHASDVDRCVARLDPSATE